MATYKLTLEYDGTDYSGWQRQPNALTIQEIVESSLEQITQCPVPIIAAGRTDSGVHALGQVISFHSTASLKPQEWIKALNRLLPPDIAVVEAEEVPDDFHARYSAIGKIYEYRIRLAEHRSALDRHRLWHIPRKLDVLAMEEAGKLFIGEHDFSSFQNARTDNKNPICIVNSLRIKREGLNLHLEIQANRFLKQMVRAIVGTLVEVGLGKRKAVNIKEILKATDRRAAGKTAAPQGLYLIKVLYG